ncbi:trigger factor [Fictibacillus macauensis ZFHKF-1]|uniref:Trigger factor n=1 Tax=Fictibacillus macauensis ZFHKF-1 TaxID=1196324 RepID=I8UEN0_9BACL|nr:trigger factor [Fictibacillus macauensis]EIT85365.1 trigger factor [Fictibacillus macauensis ZFHKF-1]
MSAKWEKLEGNQGVLTVEVEASEVDTAIDQAFKKVVKKVNVPGFRKGKIPRKMFEQRFGIESLYQDALDIILPKAYSNAVEETGIEPVDRPEVDIEQMEQGTTLVFTAKVVVKPEVKLGDYKGLEVTAFDATVTDEDVDNELKTLQEQQAELVVKEDGEITDGDTAVIDFEGFVDGEAFEGGKADNYPLEIGSGSFIPGFEEQLIGEKAGVEKDVNVNFPEEYHAEELAGKAAVFKVKVHEIKSKQLPELNDEFAKEADEEVDSLDALKAKLRGKLEESKKHEGEHHTRDTVVEKAVEAAEVDVPEAMINTELDRMVQEFGQRLQMQGMNLDLYFQFSGTDEEALRSQMKDDAATRVKTNLVLEAISVAENIEPSEEEITEELNKMAEMYNMDVEQIKQMLAMQGGSDAVAADLKVRKAIDLLVENSKTVA